MRVLILSPFGTNVNPYVGLFREGLISAGADVQVVRELERGQLVAGATPDIVHLHWIEQYDRPSPLRPHSASGPLRALERASLRPFNAGLLYHYRRWRNLRRLFADLDEYRRQGGRTAYTVHNLDPHEAGSSPERWALRRMIETAGVLHVHDRSTAETIAERYGRRGGVVVIPHGHYLAAYPNNIPPAEARARLAIPADGFVYVCLGLMRPYKGLEELLPAFRSLSGERLRLVVAGRPPGPDYVDHLRSLASHDQRIVLEPRFIPSEEVQIYLNAADIAVLPYRQITTSGAALLAFSFGLPVIAPSIGAFPNLVTAERGVLYSPGQLVQAMQAAQQTDWSDTREATEAWVRQFDWEDIGQRLLDAYAAAGARQ